MSGGPLDRDPARARLQLLEWQRIDKGLLLGKGKVLLPCGLEISDVAVFEKDGRQWATLPAELLRDMGGQPLKDSAGKARYRSSLKWSSRELGDGFSRAVIAAIEAEHGPLGQAGAAP
jgi:hypothetical protein